MYAESFVSGSAGFGSNHNVVPYDYNEKKTDSGKVPKFNGVTLIFDYLVIWFIWEIAIYFYIYYVMLSEDLGCFYVTWRLILLFNKIRFENKIKYLVVG